MTHRPGTAQLPLHIESIKQIAILEMKRDISDFVAWSDRYNIGANQRHVGVDNE